MSVSKVVEYRVGENGALYVVDVDGKRRLVKYDQISNKALIDEFWSRTERPQPSDQVRMTANVASQGDSNNRKREPKLDDAFFQALMSEKIDDSVFGRCEFEKTENGVEIVSYDSNEMVRVSSRYLFHISPQAHAMIVLSREDPASG